MSSGIFHLRATLLLTPVAALGGAMLHSPEAALWASAGCLSGIVLTPDLDQETLSHVEHRIIRLTLGLGYVWMAFWGPYSTLIPHRSFLSHGPLISTVIRLLYLWGGLILVVRLLSIPLVIPPLEVLWVQPHFQAFFWGLVLSDLSHWVLDLRGISTGLRKVFPEKAHRNRRS